MTEAFYPGGAGHSERPQSSKESTCIGPAQKKKTTLGQETAIAFQSTDGALFLCSKVLKPLKKEHDNVFNNLLTENSLIVTMST